MTSQTILATFEGQRPHHHPALGYEEVEIHLRDETCRAVSVKSAVALEDALRQQGFAVRTSALALGGRNVTVTAPVTNEAAFRTFKAQVARLVRSHLGISCLVPEGSSTIH